jgi:hypothetical protein
VDGCRNGGADSTPTLQRARGTVAISTPRRPLAGGGAGRTVVAAATVECAGLLVGHIVHDPERSAAALTITTQIPVPAGQGGASNTHFAFGPGSFRAAKQALNSFTNGCVSAGWWHSHPPCENCPQNPTCVADTVFFSPDDMQVHASAFSAAFAVALVAGKVRDRRALDPGFRLYGWQGGAIRERALRIASRSNTEMLRAAPVGAME